MRQRCKVTGEDFEVAQEDLELLAKISPEFPGRKLSLPPPQIAGI